MSSATHQPTLLTGSTFGEATSTARVTFIPSQCAEHANLIVVDRVTCHSDRIFGNDNGSAAKICFRGLALTNLCRAIKGESSQPRAVPPLVGWSKGGGVGAGRSRFPPCRPTYGKPATEVSSPAVSANCGNCGETVEADGPGMPARDDFHLHFAGYCPSCELTLQWHQTVTGMIGSSALLSNPRPCPSRCKHHNPSAARPGSK
jgi:hypothetical protein